MMYHDGWWFFGMHALWWAFWILVFVVLFRFLEPIPRSEARRRRATPLEILQKRCAAGEITTQEYDVRRAKLVADTAPER